MTLSEFCKIIYPYWENECKTQPDFMVKLFGIAIDIENIDHVDLPLLDKKDYLNKIFNGKELPKKSLDIIYNRLNKDSIDNFMYSICEPLSDEALIELCHEFEPYIGNSTVGNICDKLAETFIEIINQLHNKGRKTIEHKSLIYVEQEIYEQINFIIRQISLLSTDEIDNILRYDAYNIDKKIVSNEILKKEIKNNVVYYYTYIEKAFEELSSKNSYAFNKFAEQVQKRADEYIDDGLSPQLVFDKMCDWLKERTQCISMTACRIMISFFVQNCEVFHVITK